MAPLAQFQIAENAVKLDGTTRQFHRRTSTTAPNPLGVNMMKAVANSFFSCVVLIIGTNVSTVAGDDFTAGDFHNYTHDSGDVPKNDYQYSVFVPKDYDGKKSYPVVVFTCTAEERVEVIQTWESETWFRRLCVTTTARPMQATVETQPTFRAIFSYHL